MNENRIDLIRALIKNGVGTSSYLEGDEARGAFNEQCKNKAILPDNNTRRPTAYRIEDASKITYRNLDMLADVTLTSTDLMWTHSKTNELWSGPFFYKAYW